MSLSGANAAPIGRRCPYGGWLATRGVSGRGRRSPRGTIRREELKRERRYPAAATTRRGRDACVVPDIHPAPNADRARPAARPPPRRHRRDAQAGRPGPSPPRTQASRARRPRPRRAQGRPALAATAQRPRRGAAPARGARSCARGEPWPYAWSETTTARYIGRLGVTAGRAAPPWHRADFGSASASIPESARAARHSRPSRPAPHGTAAMHGATDSDRHCGWLAAPGAKWPVRSVCVSPCRARRRSRRAAI